MSSNYDHCFFFLLFLCFLFFLLIFPLISFPFWPSSPAWTSTHLLFYRSEFPDSCSHSCCSCCWCPQCYERPQSEFSHQSQVEEKRKHTQIHTHTSSNYNKKLGLCRFWIVSSFTVQSSFSLPGQSLKLWSTRRSVKRLARIKRYMFDHLLFFPTCPFVTQWKHFCFWLKMKMNPLVSFTFF